MDNPGISLFQGADININNSQNYEEEEDLEDQLRRKEELQNLLQANLDDFKYDDSTINSSANVSLISHDNLEQIYKDAITPNEQLRVLYDVRLREIQALKEEYAKFKEEKNKNIESIKTRNILFESEIRQLKVSLNNAESLLVEKTDVINKLSDSLQKKDIEIKELEKLLKNYETDITTYKSELIEVQLKLQSQNGPFNLNAKYNSEELQKSLQEKISKLENALEKESKKAEVQEKDNQALQEEIQRLYVEKVDLETENSAVVKTLDSAQQQCKDLIDVVEMIKRENDHFKERLLQTEENKFENLEFSKRKSLDNVTLLGHNEKLKRMLLDRSVEMDTLRTKLRYYENDLKELVEYRQLKSDVYKKEFQKCDNQNHTKELLLMQNDLQNYRRTIDDKNQQILNLNANNKDLKEKIEEMLLQTRTEIQNFSHKYNVPKLEVMSKELEKSEALVKELNGKLEESEERRLSLLKKVKKNVEDCGKDVLEELKKCRTELNGVREALENERQKNLDLFKELEREKSEVLRLKSAVEELKIDKRKLKNEKNQLDIGKNEDTNLKSEYEQLKNQLTLVMKHLEKNNKTDKAPLQAVAEIKTQMDQFLENMCKENVEKDVLEERISMWKKLLDEIRELDHDEALKKQYKEAVMNLHEAQDKIKDFEDTVQDLKNAVTIAEGEKCSLAVELKERNVKYENVQKVCKALENEVKRLRVVVKEIDMESLHKADARESKGNNEELEVLRKELVAKVNELELLKKELKKIKGGMEVTEKENGEFRKWLERMTVEFERVRGENSRLESELKEANDRIVRRNLSKELQNAEEGDKKNAELNDQKDTEYFKNRLNEELMKSELILRDELQIEYQKRISDIEKRYQDTCREANELCKQQAEKLKQQDQSYRGYLKMVLTECEKCMNQIENEKLQLAEQFRLLKEDFDKCRTNLKANDEQYSKTLKVMEAEHKKNIEAWTKWSKTVVSSCLGIEEVNKKVRDKVITNLKLYDEEVEAIQKAYKEKIKKKSSKKM